MHWCEVELLLEEASEIQQARVGGEANVLTFALGLMLAEQQSSIRCSPVSTGNLQDLLWAAKLSQFCCLGGFRGWVGPSHNLS